MAYIETHLLNLRGAKSILQTIDSKLNIIRTKLNTIETGAQVNTVDSVNQQTGNVTLTCSNIGAEDVLNKVTSISSTSTDTEYPSARCIYTQLVNIEDTLTVLLEGTGS